VTETTERSCIETITAEGSEVLEHMKRLISEGASSSSRGYTRLSSSR
jgi:hypothetical protein